jgi:hypothetical protein
VLHWLAEAKVDAEGQGGDKLGETDWLAGWRAVPGCCVETGHDSIPPP